MSSMMLSASGMETSVLFQLVFAGYKNRLYSSEVMDGIKVIRVWSYITKNRGTLRRILDYMSFAVASFMASLFRSTDVIVATSPQLFTAVGGYLASRAKGKPWIMEVRDLWPESIKAVDAMDSSRILDRLQVLVDFLYRKADRLVVVTNSFKTQIGSVKGVDESKIDVVTNGVNGARFFPRQPNERLIAKLQLSDKFIVGYIGTHGMAHNLDFILDCAKKVTDKDVHFLFVGDGALKGRLLKKIVDDKVTNVTMLSSVDREEVHQYLSLIDASLIPLKKSETFKSVIPSKIFENAAMGKPILLGVEGEAKKIVSDYSAGLCFIPENEADFLNKLASIKEDKFLYEKLSKGGLKLASVYNREKLAEKMLSAIRNASLGSKGVGSEELARPSRARGRRSLITVVDLILFLTIISILYMIVF